MSMSWLFPLLLLILTIYAVFYQPYLAFFTGFVLIISLAGIRVIYQYEKGVKFTLGKYTGLLGPGLRYIVPIVEKLQKIDLRIITVDIPKQEVMTRDNVPVRINGVVYFKVKNPEEAILKIQDFQYAISQYSLTALRDIVGNQELDSVLTQRDKIANEIEKLLDKETAEWGLDVTAIKLQDIELPENMKRVMAKQAQAEREKRAVIIKAEGEVAASKNLRSAAETLSKSPAAIHLRTLQTITDVAPNQGNTIVFTIPLEMMRAFDTFNQNFGKKRK